MNGRKKDRAVERKELPKVRTSKAAMFVMSVVLTGGGGGGVR